MKHAIFFFDPRLVGVPADHDANTSHDRVEIHGLAIMEDVNDYTMNRKGLVHWQ